MASSSITHPTQPTGDQIIYIYSYVCYAMPHTPGPGMLDQPYIPLFCQRNPFAGESRTTVSPFVIIIIQLKWNTIQGLFFLRNTGVYTKSTTDANDCLSAIYLRFIYVTLNHLSLSLLTQLFRLNNYTHYNQSDIVIECQSIDSIST